jgi:hypothetical protein
VARAMRKRQDQLQTAVWHYIHATTGSRLTLIGMIHVGNEAYYQRVRQTMMELESAGAQVHYERVRKLTDEQFAALSDHDRVRVERNRQMSVTRRQVFDLIGLSHQMDHLNPPDSWLNTDMDELTLARKLPLRKKNDINFLDNLKDERTKRIFSSLLRFALRHITLLYVLSLMLTWIKPKARLIKRVILGERNDIALAAVVEAKPHQHRQDLVLNWGAAHLPGIHRGLQKLGYTQTGQEWFSAVTLT